jgi:uncharacterized membrane protein YGL010W
MPKKQTEQWFEEYGESHRHATNAAIHWVCVPAIFWSLLGLLWVLPVPAAWVEAAPLFNWALPAMVAATVFYVWLSPPIAAGMLFFMALCYAGLVLLEIASPWPIGRVAAIVFGLAWIGQFVGHRIEGKKPAFLRDAIFLPIGPAWLLAKLYRRIGQKY